MKQSAFALLLAILVSFLGLPACGNDTASSSTNASSSSGGESTTQPTTGGPGTDSATSTTAPTSSATEVMTTDPLTTSTTDVVTTGLTETGSTGDESGTTTSTSTTEDGTGSSTTSDVDACELPCPDGNVTREQVAMNMGKPCEEIFNVLTCEKPQEGISRAEATKVVYWWLQQAGKLGACEDFMPPAYPDVDPMDWYFEFIQTRHCLGLLKGMPNGNFCPGNFACKGWWEELWAKAQAL